MNSSYLHNDSKNSSQLNDDSKNETKRLPCVHLTTCNGTCGTKLQCNTCGKLGCTCFCNDDMDLNA